MKIARRKFKVEVPNVAMGDIAFNLLVFFVILARAQDDSHVKWSPASATQVEPTKRPKASIAVDQDNKLYLDGREIGQDQLLARLEDRLGESPIGERTVLLKIHETTQANRFEPILEAVSQAGGEIVHVLKEKKEK